MKENLTRLTEDIFGDEEQRFKDSQNKDSAVPGISPEAIRRATEKSLARTQSLKFSNNSPAEIPTETFSTIHISTNSLPMLKPVSVRKISGVSMKARLIRAWGKIGKNTYKRIFNIKPSQDETINSLEDFKAYIEIVNVTYIKINSSLQPIAELSNIKQMQQLIELYTATDNVDEKEQIKQKMKKEKAIIDDQIKATFVKANLNSEIQNIFNSFYHHPKNSNFLHLGHEAFRAKLEKQKKSIDIREQMIILSQTSKKTAAIRIISEGFNVTDHSQVVKVENNSSPKGFYLLPPKIIESKEPIITFDTKFVLTPKKIGAKLKLESTTEIIRHTQLTHINSKKLWNRVTNFFKNISFFGIKKSYKERHYKEPPFTASNANFNPEYFQIYSISRDLKVIEQIKAETPKSKRRLPPFSSFFFKLRKPKTKKAVGTEQSKQSAAPSSSAKH